jgi:vacuolar-type H+-ATPase subunit H
MISSLIREIFDEMRKRRREAKKNCLADGQSDIGEVQSDDGDSRRRKPSI